MANDIAADRPRTQVERRATTEAKLLYATAELVAEQGAAATSIAQICQRAGYSRGIVNHHFGTRAALFRRLVEETQAAFIDSLTPVPGARGIATILGLCRLYVDAQASPDPRARAFLLLWVGAAGADEELRPAMAQSDIEFRDGLALLIREGIADGTIRADADPDALAVTLVGALRGLILQSLVNPALATDEQRDGVIAAIKAMLAA